MAEVDYGIHGTQAPESYSLGAGAFINIIGGVVSLALIAGICVWGYQLLARDVSGVPVVLALDGPMRKAPEDPGGRQAAHQGLAVNEVAATGLASGPRDRLVLAPEAVGLADEDVPLQALTPAETKAETSAETPAQTKAETPAEIVADEVAATEGLSAAPQSQGTEIETRPLAPADELDMEALLAQLANGAEPLAPLDDVTDAGGAEPVVTALAPLAADTGATAAPDLEAAPAQEAAPEEVAAIAGAPEGTGALDAGPGPRRSLRPQLRPASLDTAPVPLAPVPEELDPADIPAGTRLVQLGAFDSADVARSEWGRLDDRFGSYMTGKTRVIEQATKAGRTFYRLRAHGFDDVADARRFCSALVAQDAACIPVLVE